MANNAVDASPTESPADLPAIVAAATALEAAAGAMRCAEDLLEYENKVDLLAAEFKRLLMDRGVTAAVGNEDVLAAARALAAGLPRRLRSDGLQPVSVRFAGNAVVKVMTPYLRERSRVGNRRRPGLYPVLAVLGICDRCTPKLASDVSRTVAMLGSLAEAATELAANGIDLDVKTVRSIAYRFAARARVAQASKDYRWGDSASGRRLVVSIDGGRSRIRRKKRGRKTKKGRTRFRGSWEEPKLLIVYVVDAEGRPLRTWAPVIDGTLRGPDAIYALLLSYAQQLDVADADRILFVADGAPWIMARFNALIAELHLAPEQVLLLIDFYHAAKQLADAVKLRRWSAKHRTRWLGRTRHLLRHGHIDAVMCELDDLRRGGGRNAGKIATHWGYFNRNYGRFAYPAVHALGFPMGSGAMESAVRRVVNLRIKGNSIFWRDENIEAILLLRSFYKARRWRDLERMAGMPQTIAS